MEDKQKIKKIKKIKFWELYLLVLAIYHLAVPLKPTFGGWLYAWGVIGIYESFILTPINFFCFPLLISFTIYIIYRIIKNY